MVDETDPKAHFEKHTRSLVDAAKGLAETSKKLRKAKNGDEREHLHNQLDAQIAETHAAVNNALTDPPPPAKENTGGALAGPIEQPGVVQDPEVG